MVAPIMRVERPQLVVQQWLQLLHRQTNPLCHVGGKLDTTRFGRPPNVWLSYVTNKVDKLDGRLQR